MTGNRIDNTIENLLARGLGNLCVGLRKGAVGASMLALCGGALAACRPAPTTATPTEPAPPEAGPQVAAQDITVAGPDGDKRVPDDLSPLLDEVRERAPIPGLAAAVIDSAGVLAIGVSGTRRSDEPAPLQPTDAFHLGSDTKAMTATLVARLVDAGTLRWDMTLGEAFAGSEAWMHPDFRAVTLTQLLRHRAGVVANIADVPGFELGAFEPAERRAKAAQATLSLAPASTPGSKFFYSNLGYVVAGAVIEEVTGKSWEAVMEAELFEPRGMATCGFGPTATGDARDQPWAHTASDRGFYPVSIDNPPFMGPAATVHCSLADWGKFASIYFKGADFVSASSMSALVAAVPKDDSRGGGYALGWIVPDAERSGLMLLTHDGSNTVNYASIIVAPELSAAILVAANSGGAVAQQAVVATTIELLQGVRGGDAPAAAPQ